VVVLYGRCDLDVFSVASPHTLEVTNANCTSEPTNDLLFFAKDATDDIIGWNAFIDEPTNPGGTVNFEVGVVNEQLHPVSFGFSGLPGNISRVDASSDLSIGGGYEGHRVVEEPPASSSPQFSRALPTIPGATYRVRLGASIYDGPAYANFDYILEDPSPISSTIIDLSKEYGWIAMSPPDVSDPIRPRATWALTEAPAVDAAQVVMHWDLGISKVTFVATVHPSHETSLQVPEIPDHLSNYRPTSSATAEYASADYEAWGTIDTYSELIAGKERDSVDGIPTVYMTGSNAAAP
jgi:hypothetical protein